MSQAAAAPTDSEALCYCGEIHPKQSTAAYLPTLEGHPPSRGVGLAGDARAFVAVPAWRQ